MPKYINCYKCYQETDYKKKIYDLSKTKCSAESTRAKGTSSYHFKHKKAKCVLFSVLFLSKHSGETDSFVQCLSFDLS